MCPESHQNLELTDAKKVDEALGAIARDDIRAAERLLLEVVANTPPGYSNEQEDGGTASIRFWDQASFIHFVMWEKDHGVERSINWLPNAYPRAYYYLGFICVKRKEYFRAVEFLDKGLELEPSNPNFKFEKAHALVNTGYHKEALALYEGVNGLGPYVSARELGVARRGCGFVLIEMGRLDEAEAAFKSSLEIDPANKIALSELQYIDHLRKGGRKSDTESISTTGADLSNCAICGRKFEEGAAVSMDGMPAFICRSCEGRLTRKWWQFWKW